MKNAGGKLLGSMVIGLFFGFLIIRVEPPPMTIETKIARDR